MGVLAGEITSRRKKACCSQHVPAARAARCQLDRLEFEGEKTIEERRANGIEGGGEQGAHRASVRAHRRPQQRIHEVAIAAPRTPPQHQGLVRAALLKPAGIAVRGSRACDRHQPGQDRESFRPACRSLAQRAQAAST